MVILGTRSCGDMRLETNLPELAREFANVTFSIGYPAFLGKTGHLAIFSFTVTLSLKEQRELLKALVLLQGGDDFLAEEFEGAHGVLVGQGAALGLQQQGADAQLLLDVAQLLNDSVRAADHQVVLVL